jgi:hypothetical protein
MNIHVSTISFESALSLSGMLLDDRRRSLTLLLLLMWRGYL